MGRSTITGLAVALLALSAPTMAQSIDRDFGRGESIRRSEANIRRDCPECPELVLIQPGGFRMGSEQYALEGPAHQVSILRPLLVGRYEVKFGEWDACHAAGGCSHRPDDRGWGRGNLPVFGVSWEDAKQYVAWLGKRTGKDYRLLSEAEWEYVARAGAAQDVGGEGLAGRGVANCAGCGSRWDGRQPAPVGAFPPNAYGVFDMLGNVAEWVEDCLSASYKGAPTDGSARTPPNCATRVVRGGAWDSHPMRTSAAFRWWEFPASRRNIGFRVARLP